MRSGRLLAHHHTMSTDITSTSARIAALNDVLRTSGRGGMTMLSAALAAKGPAFAVKAHQAVRAFDAFDDHNDPYGEHDCASLEVDGERIIWKIDCYAPDLQHGSDDPANPECTRRVMTIMLAADY